MRKVRFGIKRLRQLPPPVTVGSGVAGAVVVAAHDVADYAFSQPQSASSCLLLQLQEKEESDFSFCLANNLGSVTGPSNFFWVFWAQAITYQSGLGYASSLVSLPPMSQFFFFFLTLVICIFYSLCTALSISLKTIQDNTIICTTRTDTQLTFLTYLYIKYPLSLKYDISCYSF